MDDLDTEMDEDQLAAQKYIPIKNKPPVACNFIHYTHLIFRKFDIIKSFLSHYASYHPPKPSRSPELRLLRKLKDDYPSIIFKAADKNLGLVAMDIHQYNDMVMAHLSDEATYTLVSNDTLTTLALHRKLVMKYDLYTDPESTPWYHHEETFLKHQRNFEFPHFYCSPKIHKAGPLKGRPIAGAVNWVTTPISRILDLRLQPLLQEHYQCILKNSQELCENLEQANNHIPQDTSEFFIITGDVTALYPNVNTARLKKIIHGLDFTLDDMVAFVLDNSYVQYNAKIYHQKTGIAMGTNAAVSLANIYMGHIVDRFLQQQPQVFYYKRYIDDLFIIWKGSKKDWLLTAGRINQMDPNININFTDPALSTTTFLDINVTWDPYNKQFDTSVYQKELNKYMYLTPKSCHTPHTFTGFIKGELTRYARLSSDPFAFNHIKKLFFQRLTDRGYSRTFLNRNFRNVSWSNRLNKRQTSSQKLLPFVIPYTLRKNHLALESLFRRMAKDFEDFIPNSKAMLVYSRTANILNLVSSSKITAQQSQLLASSKPKTPSQPSR
jgi:hypothetical protein